MNKGSYQWGEGNEYLAQDFSTCQRPDGSYYGTGGVCRKGTEVSGVPEKEKGTTLKKGFLQGNNPLGKKGAGKEFLSSLESELPSDTELSVTTIGKQVKMSTQTDKGNKIDVTFSPSEGLHFKVNGSYRNAGIKDKEERREIVSKVKGIYGGLFRSLPTGSTITTNALTEDGGGAKREEAFQKLGFSKPKTSGASMFSTKQADGSMAPGKRSSWADQMSSRDALWFAESDEDELWYTIVFGDS